MDRDRAGEAPEVHLPPSPPPASASPDAQRSPAPTGAALHHDGHGPRGVAAHVVETALPNGLWREVEALARDAGVTAFAVAWTALALLLERLAEGPVALWTEVGRDRSAWARLTPEVSAARSFIEAARAEQARLDEAVAREESPAPGRTVYGFALDDTPGRPPGNETAPGADLWLTLTPAGEGDAGRARLVADRACFSEARAGGLLSAYVHLLGAVLASPRLAPAEAPLAAVHDRAAPLPPGLDGPLCAFEDAAGDVSGLFERIVKLWPDERALVWPGGAMTFRDLDAAVATLAATLGDRGAAPGDCVAFRQGAEATSAGLVLFLTTKLATLRLKCALIPLGQQLSSDQARSQVEAVQARFLISTSPEADCLPAPFDRAPRLALDGFPEARLLPLYGEADGAPAGVHGDTALLFTSSGTTGVPKTIRIGRQVIFGLLRGLTRARVLPAVPYLMGANIGFDVFVIDIWMPWLCGRHVVLSPTERRTPSVIAAARDLGALALSISPTIASAALDDDPDCFLGYHTLHLMGEVLPPALVDRLRELAPHLNVVNGYGPSETGSLTSAWAARPLAEPGVPVGRAVPGVRVLVGDPAGRPLPAHWPGELIIASSSPALGYLDPVLTAERFVELPGEAPGPFFRSGDYGWIDGAGEVRFIGRKDRQVKLAAVRIELDGIEYRIAEVDGVAQVGVVVMGAAPSPQIVAVVQPQPGAPGEDELRRRILDHCRATLLRAATPTAVVFVSAMPTGASGKKSHSALRAMLARRNLGAEGEPAQAAPLSPEARTIAPRLVSMWRDLLRRRDKSVVVTHPGQDVVALGATSLDMMRMAERVERAFDIDMPDARFLLHPTIAAQAELVAALRRQGGEAPTPPIPPGRANLRMLRPAAASGPSRGVIIGMPMVDGGDSFMGMIAANALAGWETWSFSFDCGGRWMTETDDWLSCARSIADRLLDPRSPAPVAMLGFSSGGFIGWLVDRMLVAAGRAVTPVINLDGDALAAGRPDWRARIAPFSAPGDHALAPARMLLIRTGLLDWPGADTLDAGWESEGLDLCVRELATVSHLDCLRPASIEVYGETIEAYLAGDIPGGPRGLIEREVGTPGGGAYRLLTRPTPPTPQAVRAVSDDLPADRDDPQTRVALVFLALAAGDFELALDLAEVMLKFNPAYRAMVYARCAIFTALDRRSEAAAAAAAWETAHGADSLMRARLDAATAPPPAWAGLAHLQVDSDRAIDLALALGARR